MTISRNLSFGKERWNWQKPPIFLTKRLPKEENYALADQMRRSAVSIASNIAEGYGRTSAKEYARFLAMARGSGYELETQILLCLDLGYLKDEEASIALGLGKEVSKMLTAIIAKLGNG